MTSKLFTSYHDPIPLARVYVQGATTLAASKTQGVLLIIDTYSARNLEMPIRFSLKSRPSEQFYRPEMSQIKAKVSLRTNVKLICHKNVGLQ